MSTYIHIYKAELIKKIYSISSERCSFAEKGYLHSYIKTTGCYLAAIIHKIFETNSSSFHVR